MLDLGMSSLGSFLQMVKCNWNFVSNRQKFSSHLVEVYHRSCRCIAMSNNTSSRVPRVVVWWRCWCLVRYGLLPCHSVNKWREKSSFFDILGETLLGYNYCKLGTQNFFALKKYLNMKPYTSILKRTLLTYITDSANNLDSSDLCKIDFTHT
jgi:hypothetical protein